MRVFEEVREKEVEKKVEVEVSVSRPPSPSRGRRSKKQKRHHNQKLTSDALLSFFEQRLDKVREARCCLLRWSRDESGEGRGAARGGRERRVCDAARRRCKPRRRRKSRRCAFLEQDRRRRGAFEEARAKRVACLEGEAPEHPARRARAGESKREEREEENEQVKRRKERLAPKFCILCRCSRPTTP